MRIFTLLMIAPLFLVPKADVIQPPAPSEPDGQIGGYEYVNLGLPSGTLWATCNLGASSPHDIGDFYAWGEVEPRNYFTWENYPFTLGDFENPNTGSSWYVLEDIGDNICGSEYDAARYQWGNGWRLPNLEEMYELRMLCWSKWTTENGMNGIRVYGPNEHSIFLPACGVRFYNMPSFEGIYGYCWAGITVKEDFDIDGTPITPVTGAYSIQIDSGGLAKNEKTAKAGGNNIRAVINPSEAGIQMTTVHPYIDVKYKDGRILVDGTSTECSVTVIDLSGRAVYTGQTDNGICMLPSLSKGIYFITLANGSAIVKTQKVIIP